MEEQSLLKEKLSSPGSKNVLISTCQKSLENFISKIKSLFKIENFTEANVKNLTIYELSISGYLAITFIAATSLENFLDEIKQIKFDFNLLKNFTLTLLQKQNNLSSFDIQKFKFVIGIKIRKTKGVFTQITKVMELSSLKKIDLEIYMEKKEPKKKIFLIKKTKKRRKKDIYNKKIVIRISSGGEKKKEIVLQNSFNPNSLISISHEVKKFIKEKKTTTSVEVTNHIVEVLSKNKMLKMSFKNIQRRVYDAINVMASIGVVHKDNNIITYFNSLKLGSETGQKDKVSKIQEDIQKNKTNLISKLSEIICYKNLITKNKNSYSRTLTIDKLELPFLIINQDPNYPINITQTEDKNQLIAMSEKEIQMRTFSEIARELSFECRDDILELCEKIGGEEMKDYVEKENLIGIYYKDLIKENLVQKKEKSSKKVFDVDFSNIFNNSCPSSSGYYLGDNDETYLMNATTNFYSKLSMI